MAVHRASRFRPLQHRDRVRRGAGVRAGRLRPLPLLPRGLGRLPPRRPRDAHREAVHRRRRGARAGAHLGAGPGRATLADDGRRGRRPAHRAGGQRAAQGDRGAQRPHRLAALRADRRGRAADDQVAHPAGRALHSLRRGRDRLPGPGRGARRRDRVVRRPRQPGPHRPGPCPRPRRGHPSPSPRGGRDPRPARFPRRLHRGRGRPARPGQGGGGRAHQRPRPAREV